MKLRDIMNTEVVAVRKDVTIKKAAKLLREKEVGSVIVTDEKDMPVGIVTDRDIVKQVLAMDKDPGKIAVEEIMSAPVITADENDEIFYAVRILSESNIRRLPIVNNHGYLRGIVSIDDIIVILISEFSNLGLVLASSSKLI